MKNGKKHISFLLLLLMLSLILAGCGSSDTSDTKKKSSGNSSPLKTFKESVEDDSSEEDEETDEDDEDDDAARKEKLKKKKEAAKKKASSDADEEEDLDIKDGELSSSELREIGEDLTGQEYYGFLLSEYDDPRDIDLDEVFYNGAGLDIGRIPDKVEKAYLKQVREEELICDLTVIPADEMEDFVYETTGYDYSEMNNPLTWTYLRDFDYYCFEHGDTNYMNFDLDSGSVKNGIYTVWYDRDNWGNGAASYVVKFKKTKNGYQFLSNRSTGGSSSDNYDIDQSYDPDYESYYVFSDSDSRNLSKSELYSLTDWQLRVARNEIYARHGRKFNDSELQSYFNSMPWYFGTVSPSNWDDSVLNKYEKDNIKLISDFEKNNSATSSSSSGYTDYQLCMAALNYYDKNNNYMPDYAEIDSRSGNIVSIHLYDDMGDHTATSAWYDIDVRTGKGTDTIFGTKVDLTPYIK